MIISYLEKRWLTASQVYNVFVLMGVSLTFIFVICIN